MFVSTKNPDNVFTLLAERRGQDPAMLRGRALGEALRLERPAAPPSVDELRARLRGIGDDLQRLLAGVAAGVVRRAEAITEVLRAGTIGTLRGDVLAPRPTAASRLEATREVNEQLSTARASAARLGLDTTTAERVSSIGSAAEINAATTSYEKVQLGFARSTTVAKLSGTYAGTAQAGNATTLTIEFKNGGTITAEGVNLDFKVRDRTSQLIFHYNGVVRADEAISMGPDIGLAITFSAGTAVKHDEGSTGVSNSAGTNVDPDAAFDAAGNLAPRFEGGAVVTAGSFTVDGTRIDVQANDSINSVLARIEEMVPGLQASFEGDRVTLSTTDFTRRDIVLGDDTSGFLAATKLAGATTSRGFVHGDDELLTESAVFGGVTAGSFRVNGVEIALDPESDSLQAVLARVNAAGAGVTASYDAAQDRVIFTTDEAGAPLSLEEDGTGFLAAAGIFQGTRGTRVNIDARFDGTGLDAPLFDPGVSVGAGSFLVNGAEIAVSADDTVRAVLARISASDAGVDARFDQETETVSLVSRSPGATPITVGGDTSGFLAAVKLDETARNVVGSIGTPSIDAPLAELGLSGVTDGVIVANGQRVDVSTAASLRELAEALDALPGMRASLGEDGRLTPWTEKVGGRVELADSSGLLRALGISATVLQGRAAGVERAVEPGEERLADPAAAAAELNAIARRLDDTLKAVFQRADVPRTLQDETRAALGTVLALEGSTHGAVSLQDGSAPQVAVDEERVRGILARTPAEFSSFLSGIAALAEGLPAAVQRASLRDGAAQRQAEVKAGVSRDLVQIEAGTAAALERVLQARLVKSLETSAAVPEEEKRSGAVEEAKKAYGRPDGAVSRTGEQPAFGAADPAASDRPRAKL